MDLKTLFLVILMVVFIDADCTGGVETCRDSFNQNVAAHSLSSDTLCNDMVEYVKCVFRQGCDIGNDQKQYLIETTKNFKCSFTMKELIDRYGNSAALLSPINTSLITIMSFTLLIMNTVLF